MSSRCIRLILLISFKLVYGYEYHYQQPILFGFKTPSKDIVDSGYSLDDIELTLFWSTLSFSCIVKPIKYDTYYTCNTSQQSSITICNISNTILTDKYALQIDNIDPLAIDHVTIEEIMIQTSDSTLTYDYFHFNIPSTQNADGPTSIIISDDLNPSSTYDRIGIDSDERHPYILINIDPLPLFSNESSSNIGYINTMVYSAARTLCKEGTLRFFCYL